MQKASILSEAASPAVRRRPLIMGVINVTPDSFSDGGRFLDADSALEHGRRLADAGALRTFAAMAALPGLAQALLHDA